MQGDCTMKYMIILVSLLYSLNTGASASDLGPEIGTQIPHMLAATDHTGKKRAFSDLTGKNGLVISFVRSAKWCPYCMMQLTDLQEKALSALASRGYSLTAISYDAVDKLANFAHKRHIEYPLLSDQGSAIIKAFGILNKKYKPGSSAYGIPHPLIVITDATGTITAKLYEEGYKKRPQVAAILAAIDGLK